ncbi:hypothetical protein HO133_008422 [Letharia lupina]|uniref:Beta-lactamase-like ARB-00930-like C-terminal domain-containing protein n=1 Tax=Letharia lupina TaxID=560253 RepID=A0A8H6CPQ9_9LECA|nr:uncharacterized protein HO133_008422 [Letharia lupina]KAF6226981.1 hypothetical protein HO133_008422 [Letharia lupina]
MASVNTTSGPQLKSNQIQQTVSRAVDLVQCPHQSTASDPPAAATLEVPPIYDSSNLIRVPAQYLRVPTALPEPAALFSEAIFSLPLRPDDPNNRVTDLNTKEGNIGLYRSSLILSPDHNIGITVLVASTESGPERTMLKNSLIDTFLPAVEHEAQQQASNRFSRVYISPGNSSKTSFAIATDDRPGLGLFNATTINGTPLQLIAESQGLGGANKTLSVRLYPTGLKTTATTVDKKGIYTSRMSFRATFEALPQSSGMGWCQTWESIDGNTYGGVGTEEFVFGFSERGSVAYVEWRALRERLIKSG